MEFNQIIVKKLDSLFTKYGLEVTEQSNDFIKYESQRLIITLIHNHRENLSTLYIGKDDRNLLMIDGNIIKKFFYYNLDRIFIIPEKTIDDFVNNLLVFFNGKGKKLLAGDELLILKIEKFLEDANFEYTVNLAERQYIEAAKKAWENGNYWEVINNLKRVNKSHLPASLQKKLKIAEKKFKG